MILFCDFSPELENFLSQPTLIGVETLWQETVILKKHG